MVVERRPNVNQWHNGGHGRLFCYLASSPCPPLPLAQSHQMPACLLVFLPFLYPSWDAAQIQLFTGLQPQLFTGPFECIILPVWSTTKHGETWSYSFTMKLSCLPAHIHVSFAGVFFRKCVVDQPPASEPFGKVVCSKKFPGVLCNSLYDWCTQAVLASNRHSPPLGPTSSTLWGTCTILPCNSIQHIIMLLVGSLCFTCMRL